MYMKGKNCHVTDGRLFLDSDSLRNSRGHSIETSLDLHMDLSNVELPEGFSVNGRIEFNDTQIKKFPDRMYAKVLTVTGRSPSEWPEGLIVDGLIDLSGSSFKTLPTGMKSFGYKIRFENADIDFLEDDINVQHSASFYSSKLKAIPNNMHINKSLDIMDTECEELGANLYVGRHLELEGASISVIKENVVVKGKIIDFDIKEFLERNPSNESIANCISMLEGCKNYDEYASGISEMKDGLLGIETNKETETKKPPTMRF